MKITIDAALAPIQSHLKQAGVPQALLQLRRLHRSIKPRRFTLNQLVIDLARRVQMSDPKSALELIDFVLKSSPNDDAAIVLAIGLCDRTGDQARARSLADKIVRQSQSATPEQKITAANLLVRLLDDPISIETALEAYETLGRPLQWASTVLYIAQRSAHWGAVNQIIKQLNAAYAEGGQLHVTRESPRTHVLWCDDEQINIDVLKYWSSTALKSKTRAIPVAPLGGRKIKLGYLSSDYREHPTSRLVNGLFRHHDRSRFELHMYCSGWDDGSPMRREVESHFDYIHQVTNLSDEKAAELIRSHGIDVLVELNGPTRANRMGILAERAAPVQIDYLGWPGSVGGGPVDYVIGDFYTVPEGAEKLYPERVIRIDQIYQVNDYAARTLPPAPSRASMGLPEDVLVIGMFNAINKVRADVWRVWMEILKAVPNSVLWILDPGKAARKYIGTYTKALGIDPKRIVAAPNLRQEAHLARLQCCDLMLDPWPYGGHTSTSDALFAGVPVVAMKCNNFAGRVSAGLLAAAGLEQLVATDIQKYARIAVHLLRNPDELEKVKAFVKTRSPKLDVFNAAGKARQLEQAYRVALERAIEGLPPRHIAFQPPEANKSDATLARAKTPAKPDEKKIRINLCDPGLIGVSGHHFDLAMKMAKWLTERGYDLRVFSHVSASEEVRNAISAIAPVQPLFRASPYDNPMRYDPYAGELMLYQAQSRVLAQDLSALPIADLWLWPTLTAAQVKACALVKPQAKIAGCVHMPIVSDEYPSGQIWWRDALLAAKRASLAVRLGAIEPEHRYQYLPLTTDGIFHVYPTYFDGITASKPRSELRTVGFFGHQRGEKGAALAPSLAEKLLEAGYNVILHDSSERLRLKKLPGLTILGFVPDLTVEIAKCDLVVLPYEPARYKYKASGLLMDALASGVPVVAPFDTAPGRWIDKTKAGTQFVNLQVDSVMQAIEEARTDFSKISQAAYDNSLNWKSKYGLDLFMKAMIGA